MLPRYLTIGSPLGTVCLLVMTASPRTMAQPSALASSKTTPPSTSSPSDTERLLRAWQHSGLRDIRRASMMATDGHTVPIVLQSTRSDDTCLHVALIGPRTSSLRLVTTARDYLVKQAFPQDLPKGAASVLSFRLCGDQKAAAAHTLALRLKTKQPALIDMITARGGPYAPPVVDVLPQRMDNGRPDRIRVRIPPPNSDVRHVDRSYAAQHGFPFPAPTIVERKLPPADRDGSTSAKDTLAAGCHVYTLTQATKGAAVVARDLDIELFSPPSPEPIAVDRTYAPNATVTVCNGQGIRIFTRALGILPGSRVTLRRASWPLPPGIPKRWLRDWRANAARAALRFRSPWIATMPRWSGQGGLGETQMSVSLTPGQCYLAIAAGNTDATRSMSLRTSGKTYSPQDSGSRPYAAVTFCAQRRGPTQLVVSALGSQQVHWVAAIWSLSHVSHRSRNTR